MSEREKILRRHFKSEKWQKDFNDKVNCERYCYYGNRYGILPTEKKTQMQKLWEIAFGKIYDAIYRFGAWCGRIIALPISK
jgi:hypothetical protein